MYSRLASHINRFVKSEAGTILLITVNWQVFFAIIGGTINHHGGGLNYMSVWDGAWYLSIIGGHYHTPPASAAFFPLYPMLVWLISLLTFHALPLIHIGLLINTISLWLGLTALVRISKHFLPITLRFLPAVFLCLAPAAFFFHLFYSEALFIGIAFWAYAFALERRWLTVGVLLGILTACRFPAILFVGLCGLEYLRAYQWNIYKAFNRNLCYFLLAPLGFISFGTYLFFVQHNFFAMFTAQYTSTQWNFQKFDPNIIGTLLDTINTTSYAFFTGKILQPLFAGQCVTAVLTLSILLATSIFLLTKIKGAAIPLGWFGIASFIMATINSFTGSAYRIIMPCLSMYIALALLYCHNKKSRPVIYAAVFFGFILQIYLYVAIITTNIFIG